MDGRRGYGWRLRRARAASLVVFGALVAATMALAGTAAGDARHRPGDSGGPVIRSQFEQAQGLLSGGDAIGVFVTAVDFVDADLGPGTTTAVDVLFPDGECVATGPLDFRPRGLRRARVSGELTAECFVRTNGDSFTADVSVDLTWIGSGPIERITFPSDPAVPCEVRRLQRPATISGSVTVDGPDGGLHATATPSADPFDQLIRQREPCQSQPAS